MADTNPVDNHPRYVVVDKLPPMTEAPEKWWLRFRADPAWRVYYENREAAIFAQQVAVAVTQKTSRAFARGKGVLFLTAHFGGWELSAFTHSMHGHWMHVVMRPMDNPYLNRLICQYREMHGNKMVEKDDFVRGLLSAMKAGEVVGILMDTNMTPPQGAFVNFFGIPACTATGVARVALHTGAAVLPAFTVWDKQLGKYKIRFDPALQLVCTGNEQADVLANTALFNKVIEGYAMRYPEQWLWVHRRWKTRPPGEQSLY